MNDNSIINLRKETMRLKQILNEVPFSRSTLYRMRQAGKFPKPIKVGGAELWLRSDVEGWKIEILGSKEKDAA